MKINKLLFFLLAVFSLNSCVEYVDNGTEPDGPEKPEEQVFVAKLSEESEGEFVGDEFIFEATLNGVDVTSATTFKVNGVDAKGNVFKAIKEGENAVLATMDDFTSTFRFTVKEKDEEPEPDGNRIEYKGKSYPFTSNSLTQWAIYVDPTSQDPIEFTEGGALYTAWQMANIEFDASGEDIVNLFVTTVLVPLDANGNYLLPYEGVNGMLNMGGEVMINKATVFESISGSYTFASTGNTPPTSGQGTADYSGNADGKNSGETASVFWKGNYVYGTLDYKGAKSSKFNIQKITPQSINQIKNLKIAK